MRRIVFVMLLNILMINTFSQKVMFMENAQDSVSYAIGVSLYESVKNLNIELDIDFLVMGIRAGSLNSPIFSPEAVQKIIIDYMANLESKAAEGNKAAGENFLRENAKSDQVVVTGSGLQYKVIVMGDGAIPNTLSKVKVHYAGFLLDGTKFDSSYDRGEPAEFGVTQVIKGWTEVLQLMPVGSVFKVFIPSDLAYGNRAVGEDIKPGSVLVFDIELLDIIGD